MTPERCPDCGRFAADGENTTPYGSERYLWCSTCMKFVPDQLTATMAQVLEEE